MVVWRRPSREGIEKGRVMGSIVRRASRGLLGRYRRADEGGLGVEVAQQKTLTSLNVGIEDRWPKNGKRTKRTWRREGAVLPLPKLLRPGYRARPWPPRR
jgi:hypothetical protein